MQNAESRALPRAALAALIVAAALVAAGSARRLALILPRDSQISRVSGIWVAMAMDFAQGEFYRPLLSADEYGGTRYFPLHFVLHGWLIRTGMDPIRAGYPITFAATIALVAGLYFLLRQFGLDRVVCAAVSILALCTTQTQLAITTVRGDLLPTALDVWGVAFAACWMGAQGRRSDGVWAAIFFALAFIGKETMLFGLAAAVGALFLTDRRRDAGRLAALSAGLMAVLFLATCLFSQGRFLSNLIQCGSGGYSWAYLRHLPPTLVAISAKDPFGIALVALALGVLLGSGRAVWQSFPALWLLTCTAGTLVMLSSPGVRENHLIDPEIAAVVFIAFRTLGDEAWAPFGGWTLALLALTSFGSAYFGLQKADLEPRRQQLREVYRIASRSGKPILTENAALEVANDVRPVMLDNFMTRVLRDKDPAVTQRLWSDLESHRFGAVVLQSNPLTPSGKDVLEIGNIGPGFAEKLLETYDFSEERLGYFIFVPKPASQGRGAGPR